MKITKNSWQSALSLIILLGFGLISGPSFAMETPEALISPLKASVIYNPAIKPTILGMLDKALSAHQLKNLKVNSFILSDQAIIDSIIKIAQRHPNVVKVYLHANNSHNKAAIQQLETAGIAVKLGKQHAKGITFTYKNNDKENWRCLSIGGSYNLTGNAARNAEMMVVDPTSPIHNAQKVSPQSSGKKRGRTDGAVIAATPLKRTRITTDEHDVHGSLAQRIENTVQGDKLYFASMNYGDKAIHKALLEAAKKGVVISILLDKAATSINNLPLLDELAAHKKVHIAFPTGVIKGGLLTKNGHFHKKYLVRKTSDGLLAYVSTANATERGQEEFNASTFYPNPELAQSIIEKHVTEQKQGVTYAQVQALSETERQPLRRLRSSRRRITFGDPE